MRPELISLEGGGARPSGSLEECDGLVSGDPEIDTSDAPVLPGDSSEQREAEAIIVQVVAQRLGVTLVKGRRRIGASVVEFDAISDEPPVLVEAWAHQGSPRPAQQHKLMTDAFKLTWAAATLFPGGVRKILALTDDEAAAHFQGASWMASALRHAGIEIMVIDLPGEMRDRIWAAQQRQQR